LMDSGIRLSADNAVGAGAFRPNDLTAKLQPAE